MFATFYDDFFQLTDLDENYSDDFVKDAFKIDGNGLLQPCKCNQKMSESENNDDVMLWMANVTLKPNSPLEEPKKI